MKNKILSVLSVLVFSFGVTSMSICKLLFFEDEVPEKLRKIAESKEK